MCLITTNKFRFFQMKESFFKKTSKWNRKINKSSVRGSDRYKEDR